MTDAAHMLSDSTSFGLSILAIVIAKVRTHPAARLLRTHRRGG